MTSAPKLRQKGNLIKIERNGTFLTNPLNDFPETELILNMAFVFGTTSVRDVYRAQTTASSHIYEIGAESEHPREHWVVKSAQDGEKGAG